jgi:hypothetical protein
MSSLAKDDGACPCYLNPTSNACGVWDGNKSACGAFRPGSAAAA